MYFFGLGFLGVQGMALGRDGGCGASRKCPVPVCTMHGDEFTAWPGLTPLEQDASGNVASPPLHSRARSGLEAQPPPSLGANDAPKRRPRPWPGASRTGPGSRVPPTPRRTPGIGREQENPTAKTSGTFNPGAPGRAFCSPRAEASAPRRSRTPLPSRFHGNHTKMLICALQPSRPQLIERAASPADKSQSKVYSLRTHFLSVSLRVPGCWERAKQPEPRGGSGFLESEGRRVQTSSFSPLNFLR